MNMNGDMPRWFWPAFVLAALVVVLVLWFS